MDKFLIKKINIRPNEEKTLHKIEHLNKIESVLCTNEDPEKRTINIGISEETGRSLLRIPSNLYETLNKEQVRALELACEGKNVFISGPGGTGKSHWINSWKAILKENNVFMPVCALTGCAAILLGNGSTTVHNCFGLGYMKGPIDEVVGKVLRNRRVVNKLKKIQGIIIDEVSMMSKRMMEILEKIMRGVKKNNVLWGGIQVLLLGDFYQLPPVGKDKDDIAFCFESDLWRETFSVDQHILFTTIYRQKDKVYQKILQEVRIGELSEESIEILNRRNGNESKDTQVVTRLYPKRYIVDNTNIHMYNKLDTPEEHFNVQVFTGLTTYKENGKSIPYSELDRCKKISTQTKEYEVQRIIRDSCGSDVLHLKIGTPVMCTMNVDLENGIYNGSQGKVIEFRNTITHGVLPVVKYNNGKTVEMEPFCWQSEEYPSLGIKQFPLQLAWAMTIHKSQGSSLDNVIMDLGKDIFEYGQSYVALSRVRSLEGLHLSGFTYNRIQANPIVKTFYKTLL